MIGLCCWNSTFTSAFYGHRIISSPERRTLPHLPYICRLTGVSLTPTQTFHRMLANTFDVQFPFANEASALTRTRQILSASLSLSTRHRCVAPIVLRTPITRRAKPPTSDAMIFLPGHDSPMALDTVFVKCISNMHTQKPPVFIVRLQLLQSAICCGNSYIRLSVRLSDVYRWNNLMCAYFETRVVP